MPVHTLTVDALHEHVRLDVFLTQNLPGEPSRTSVKKLFDGNCILVNNKPVKLHHQVKAGEVIVVNVPDVVSLPEHIEPENIPLNIFYEDEQIIIVNKPNGMVVHPGNGVHSGTMVNALVYHFKNLSTFNANTRPGIVHRLDKETSGLILIAKDNKTHALIARQFKKHAVYKQYVALVDGEVEFDEGMIDVPIGRNTIHREKKMVAFDDNARQALTYYKVIKRHKGITLVKLFPKTGRTHQLRVHMAHIGHPIIGDDKYGKKATFHRLALHAQSLGIIHPTYNRYIEFSTPVPEAFFKKVS